MPTLAAASTRTLSEATPSTGTPSKLRPTKPSETLQLVSPAALSRSQSQFSALLV